MDSHSMPIVLGFIVNSLTAEGVCKCRLKAYESDTYKELKVK